MIKIHPTLQTKRGMKKRERAGEGIGVCGGGGGGVWGGKPSKLPEHP